MGNLIRTFFLFLGAVFALLLFVGGVFGYLITGPAPVYEGTVDVAVSPSAAQRFDSKIEALKEEIALAQSTGYPREIAMTFTEEEASSWVAALAEDNELPVSMKFIQIQFRDGVVQASATADMVVDVHVVTQAQIAVSEGKPDISVQNLHLGRLPIPQTLTNQVMVALMAELEQRYDGFPIELQDVAVEGGELTITGVTR